LFIIVIIIKTQNKKIEKNNKSATQLHAFFLLPTFLSFQFTFLSANELTQPPTADTHSILSLLKPTNFGSKPL
jgi:hypothetical protein